MTVPSSVARSNETSGTKRQRFLHRPRRVQHLPPALRRREIRHRARRARQRGDRAVVRRRFAQLPQQQLGDRPIEVVAAQRRIAARRLHLEHAVLELEDRNVERAAAQVEDGERPLGLLVEAVRNRRRGRLVDEAQDLEPRQPTCVARRLSLPVVEVRGHRDDRAGQRAAQLALGAGLQHLQDFGRNFHRRHGPPAGNRETNDLPVTCRRREFVGRQPARRLGVLRATTHEPLHRRDRVAWELRGQSVARLRADDDGTVRRVVHHRRHDRVALRRRAGTPACRRRRPR